MDFDNKLEHYRQIVEAGLDQWTPKPTTRPARIHEAMRYSLEAGGKRIRPVLLLAGHDLGTSRADPVPAAVAIECLHTYSLIHDDLPAMDDSDLRRGRPSCHIRFDEATAVLAGDALLTHALWLLAEAYHDQPPLAVALTRELGDAAGSLKLIGGQMEDILGEQSEYTAEQLDFIHLNKTAALITAAMTMGLMLTEADEYSINLMRKAGRKIGLTFQIVDDILDATSDSATLGKTAGQDAANKKNSYVTIHGLDASRKYARELTSSAVEACGKLHGDTSFLVSLIEWLEHRIH